MLGEIDREFESRKLEARTDGAPHQRILTQTARRLPDAGRNDSHRPRIRGDGMQYLAIQLVRCWIVGQQLERRATIEVPDLIGIDDVPATELSLFEQIIDRGGRASRLDAAMSFG